MAAIGMKDDLLDTANVAGNRNNRARSTEPGIPDSNCTVIG